MIVGRRQAVLALEQAGEPSAEQRPESWCAGRYDGQVALDLAVGWAPGVHEIEGGVLESPIKVDQSQDPDDRHTRSFSLSTFSTMLCAREESTAEVVVIGGGGALEYLG